MSWSSGPPLHYLDYLIILLTHTWPPRLSMRSQQNGKYFFSHYNDLRLRRQGAEETFSFRQAENAELAERVPIFEVKNKRCSERKFAQRVVKEDSETGMNHKRKKVGQSFLIFESQLCKYCVKMSHFCTERFLSRNLYAPFIFRWRQKTMVPRVHWAGESSLSFPYGSYGIKFRRRGCAEEKE